MFSKIARSRWLFGFVAAAVVGILMLISVLRTNVEPPSCSDLVRQRSHADHVAQRESHESSGEGNASHARAGGQPVVGSAEARRVFAMETAFFAGKPAAVPASFSTPSAAEEVLRAARLAELLPGGISSLKEGDTIELPLAEGRAVHGRVNLVQHETSGQVIVGGELTGAVKGSFTLGEDDSRLGGTIFPSEGGMAYQIETGTDGVAYLLEKHKGSVLCMEFPLVVYARAVMRGAVGDVGQADSVSDDGMVVAAAAGTEYQLSSRPSAVGVVYLDFDGETVTDANWNNGNVIAASASGLSAAQITEVWQRVAEDYRPFNIDVTTNRARYDNAPAGSRMRCIVTQNSSWYGSAGGVAWVGSWRLAGSSNVSATIPCWVFSNLLSLNPRYVAEAVSHEVGHTLGLSHDGLKDASGNVVAAYYSGHGTGNTSWAPIMGSGYYSNVVQWSAGNYGTNGNTGSNLENDLAIISDPANRSGYATDDAGGSRTTAEALRYDGSQVATSGVIERTGDVDMYSFTTAGGSVSFSLVLESGGVAGQADLDARATLYNADGNVLADSNPTGSLYPSIGVSLPVGTYYLAITGVGEGAVPGTGYTNYGSLGRYNIRGAGVSALSRPVVVVDAADSSGVAITGAWSASTYYSGYYGKNYLADVTTGTRSGKKVRFTPTLPLSTAYDVYVRWTAAKDRADNVPVDIVHAAGTKTLTVNQRVAHGTWVFLGTYGFNAGTAGSVTVRNDGANGNVIVDAAKFEKAEASILPANPAVVVDAADVSGVTKSGTWAPSTYVSGYYGRDYLTDGNTSRSVVKKVRFNPALAVSGAYAVYARWTTGTNRATNVAVDIAAPGGTTRKWINQQSNHGVWYLLGTYTFNSGSSGAVTISNEGANGFVIVDAIKFERAP
jgi:hypothetical protein